MPKIYFSFNAFLLSRRIVLSHIQKGLYAVSYWNYPETNKSSSYNNDDVEDDTVPQIIL